LNPHSLVFNANDLAFETLENSELLSVKQKLNIFLEKIKHQKKISENNQVLISKNLLEKIQDTTLKIF